MPDSVDPAAPTSGEASQPSGSPSGARRPAEPRVIALLNQKGGVGKTTSTVNVGAAMAEAGERVLLVDLDPQAHLTLHLGVDGETVGATVYDVLVDPEQSVDDAIVKVRPNLDLLPAEVDLAAAESELAGTPDRNHLLVRRLAGVRDRYDWILLDCPPSLGLLTLNALVLAEEVIVPMQAHFLAMQGVGKLLETVGLVAAEVNPGLRVGGVILCMHERQTAHGREVVSELEAFFDEARGSGVPWSDAKVLLPAIRRNIKLAEAPSFGQTILDYAPWCPGAIDYRKLAERIVADRSEPSAPATPDMSGDAPTEPPTTSPAEQPTAEADAGVEPDATPADASAPDVEVDASNWDGTPDPTGTRG